MAQNEMPEPRGIRCRGLVRSGGQPASDGSLLLGYYTPDGKLIYAGRAGTGMPVAELERVWQRLLPLAVPKMPLSEPPPRGSRFGSPCVLNRVHWVRPEMVVEVSYAEWTPDCLLRHVVYLASARTSRPLMCAATGRATGEWT